ncbi:MAG: hypothetical protein K2M91_06965, partial [Lachnospiraceae bacterium]|nr:hypothetical protein [Lachnospiraceae bacterium]
MFHTKSIAVANGIINLDLPLSIFPVAAWSRCPVMTVVELSRINTDHIRFFALRPCASFYTERSVFSPTSVITHQYLY